MRTIILNDGKLEEKEINNTLEELQGIVGGYIEMPYLSKVFMENDIDLVINEEGKFIDGLKPQIAVVGKETASILDIVYGNCVFVSHDDMGNTVGLNDEQIKVVVDELKMSVVLMNQNDNVQYVVKALFI